MEVDIRKNIDRMILEWVYTNIFSNNLNQDLEYYIFNLRQTTTLITEIEYLDYKLNIWKNIEEKKKENDLILF
jgi:hypothetical protein